MLNLNPKTAALVLIDLQRGSWRGRSRRTARPRWSTRRRGSASASNARAASSRRSMSPIPPTAATGCASRSTRRWAAALPPDWAEFVSEIAALPADFVILKRQWGAFHGTELDLQLRRRGIDTILLGGVATNYGVEQTAREAWQLGYAVVVAEDASTSMGEDLHKFSIE